MLHWFDAMVYWSRMHCADDLCFVVVACRTKWQISRHILLNLPRRLVVDFGQCPVRHCVSNMVGNHTKGRDIAVVVVSIFV